MPIAYLTIELRIEGAHSLKDKRQVVRSLKDRLRNSFNISIAEIDVTDLWQRATLGVVSISGSRDYLEGLMRNVEQAATRQANNLGAEVVDSFIDYLEGLNPDILFPAHKKQKQKDHFQCPGDRHRSSTSAHCCGHFMVSHGR